MEYMKIKINSDDTNILTENNIYKSKFSTTMKTTIKKPTKENEPKSNC
jgi:hypothetical protein